MIYVLVVSGIIGLVVDRLMGFRIDEEHAGLLGHDPQPNEELR